MLNELKNLDLKGMDKESLLKSIGLQSYRTAVVPAVALFGLGVLVGAGVGLLFAPRSGQELRKDLMGRAEGLRNFANQKNFSANSDVVNDESTIA